ncbi:hypothetical protein XENTR_v10008384 [Xenopus tropicalis]|nr:hypothetical protein XENTR_v10008384 [Xenopus tropicalis]
MNFLTRKCWIRWISKMQNHMTSTGDTSVAMEFNCVHFSESRIAVLYLEGSE